MVSTLLPAAASSPWVESIVINGKEIVNRLRPIALTWKQGGMRAGLAAEEVEQVEPLLTFRNDKAEIEGVKYNQLSAVLINAIKEQQAQIREQQEQLAAFSMRLSQLGTKDIEASAQTKMKTPLVLCVIGLRKKVASAS